MRPRSRADREIHLPARLRLEIGVPLDESASYRPPIEAVRQRGIAKAARDLRGQRGARRQRHRRSCQTGRRAVGDPAIAEIPVDIGVAHRIAAQAAGQPQARHHLRVGLAEHPDGRSVSRHDRRSRLDGRDTTGKVVRDRVSSAFRP